MTLPTAATNLSAQFDPASDVIDLTWSDPNGLYTAFDIQWSTDGTNFYTIDVTSGQYPGTDGNYHYVDGYAPTGQGVTDYYRVVAFRAAVVPDSSDFESAPSNVASCRPTDPPVAFDDGPGLFGDDASDPYVCKMNGTLTVVASQGVLANDIDPNGLSLQSFVQRQPSHGTVALDTQGSFVYTPDPGFGGDDTFTYYDSNGHTQSAPATLTIHVADAPVQAHGNLLFDPSGITISGQAGPNDVNPDSAIIAYAVVANVKHGALALSTSGSFTYTPQAGYNGTDIFTYLVSDGYDTSNIATVEIAVGNSTDTSGFAVNPANPTPQSVKSFPTTLQGLWDSYSAAMDRYKEVGLAMANFGSAVQGLQNMDPTSSQATQLLDGAIAKMDIVNSAYDAYLAQYRATSALAGVYMKTIWVTTDARAAALMAVESLPVSIPGLLVNDQRLGKLQLAQQAFATGADWMVANNTFTVTAATETHDALEKSIQYAGMATLAGGILLSSAEMATQEGITAAAQLAAKQVSSALAGAVVSSIISQSAVYLAQLCGASPDAIRIGADSVQLFFLLKSARDECHNGVNCFAGNTQVDTAGGEEAIDTLHVGDRVLTGVSETSADGGPLPSDTSATEVDPATWRAVTLDMPDPAAPGDDYLMTMLEPLSWINANNASVGNWVNLSFPELQLSGEAKVTGVTACPTIQSGQGQVLLGTFEHVANDVVDVSLAGDNTPLQVTSGHKIWSLDRAGWVAAGDLRTGERVAGENGPVTVESVTANPQTMPVYNLDVEYDHRYLVTDLKVLAHNANKCRVDVNDPDFASPSARAAHDIYVNKVLPGAKQKSFRTPWSSQSGLGNRVFDNFDVNTETGYEAILPLGAG